MSENTGLSLDELTRRATAEACALDVLRPWVRALGAAHDETRAELAAALGAKGRTWTALDEGGAPLGSVNTPRTKPDAVIEDAAAFVAWVRENHPSELLQPLCLIEGVTWEQVAEELFEVDPARAERFLVRRDDVTEGFAKGALARAVGGEAVPGVVLVEKPISVRLTPTAAAKDLVAAKLGMSLPELPELGGAA